MVLPMDLGTFKHYKNGKNYRGLFLAIWRQEHQGPLTNDDKVYVTIHAAFSNPHLGAGLQPHWHDNHAIVTARWSGNAEPKYGDKVMIYVAAYDEGRIAVRLLSEFEDEIEWEGKKVRRFQPLPSSKD